MVHIISILIFFEAKISWLKSNLKAVQISHLLVTKTRLDLDKTKMSRVLDN